MARPREFDERAVLDAAVQCFWNRGFEATSVRDLIDRTGLTGASLYNAFGDKRALYQRALNHYVEASVAERIRRCERMAPLAAIQSFFDDILERSLTDPDRKGCMLVNAALETSPDDTVFRAELNIILERLEIFFSNSVKRGQADGSINGSLPADDIARHLLSTLMGVRVLARARPDSILLRGAVRTALFVLHP